MNELKFNFSDLKIDACESINEARKTAKSAPQMGGIISAITRRFVCYCAIKSIKIIAEESSITMTSPLASKMVRAILRRGVGTEIIRVNFADEKRTASNKMPTEERDRAIEIAASYSDELNKLIDQEVDYLKRYAKVLNYKIRLADLKRMYQSEQTEI